MKCIGIKVTVFLIILFIFIPVLSEDNLKEEVSITYVEVPVRVFLKGNPVKDLTKNDFKLFEDGKIQEIKSLKSITQLIESGKIKSDLKETVPVPPQEERYFVLIYRISKYNKKLEEAVNLLFNKILKKNDEVLIFINDSSIHLKNLTNISRDLPKIKDILRSESRKAYARMSNAILKIEHLGAEYLEIWENHSQSIFAVQDYLKIWKQTWKEYKHKYLIPELGYYFNFANHLEKIDKKKWVINFYQMELFPSLKTHGELRRKIVRFADHCMTFAPEFGKLIHADLINLDKDMNAAKDFPTETISKLFYKVNTTFHSIFIPTMINTLSADTTYRQISTDIENSFRDLTKKTGGKIISTTDIGSALEKISNTTSTYYLLTYEPSDSEVLGKIKIKAKNRKYKVIYDDNMRKDYIGEYFKKKELDTPQIKIKSLKFEAGNLNFILDGCLPAEKNSGKTKEIEVSINIIDNNGKIIRKLSRKLSVNKDEVKFSIPLNNISGTKGSVELKVINLSTNYISSKKINF